jgi:hypothetical protein
MEHLRGADLCIFYSALGETLHFMLLKLHVPVAKRSYLQVCVCVCVRACEAHMYFSLSVTNIRMYTQLTDRVRLSPQKMS